MLYPQALGPELNRVCAFKRTPDNAVGRYKRRSLVVQEAFALFFNTFDAQYQVVWLALYVVVRVEQGAHVEDGIEP